MQKEIRNSSKRNEKERVFKSSHPVYEETLVIVRYFFRISTNNKQK